MQTNSAVLERPDTLIVGADGKITRLPRRREATPLTVYGKADPNSRSSRKNRKAGGMPSPFGEQFTIPFRTVLATAIVAWRIFAFVKRVWWRPKSEPGAHADSDGSDFDEAEDMQQQAGAVVS